MMRFSRLFCQWLLSCISLQISDKVCVFFVNLYWKVWKKSTTLTKLRRLSPTGRVPSTGAKSLGRVNCQWLPAPLFLDFPHRGLFSLSSDSRASNRCHREINKSERSSSPTALDSCHAFFSVMGRCRASAPQLMWLDLDVDRSQSRVGEGESGTPGCRRRAGHHSSPAPAKLPDSSASALLWPPLHRLEELQAFQGGSCLTSSWSCCTGCSQKMYGCQRGGEEWCQSPGAGLKTGSWLLGYQHTP